MNLYCFPYAGGTAHTFMRFRQFWGTDVRIVPLDPSGHGARMDEPLFPDFHQMAASIVTDYSVEGNPFVFFGHSMGAYLALEETKRLAREGLALPAHLFLSGAAGPRPSAKLKNLHLLHDREILRVLKQLGGLPLSNSANDTIFDERFFPILKSDIRALSDAIFDEEDKAVPVPITVLLGRDDPLTTEASLSWSTVSSAGVDICYFPGGHFFVFDCIDDVAAVVLEKLRRLWQLRGKFST